MIRDSGFLGILKFGFVFVGDFFPIGITWD